MDCKEQRKFWYQLMARNRDTRLRGCEVSVPLAPPETMEMLHRREHSRVVVGALPQLQAWLPGIGGAGPAIGVPTKAAGHPGTNSFWPPAAGGGGGAPRARAQINGNSPAPAEAWRVLSWRFHPARRLCRGRVRRRSFGRSAPSSERPTALQLRRPSLDRRRSRGAAPQALRNQRGRQRYGRPQTKDVL